MFAGSDAGLQALERLMGQALAAVRAGLSVHVGPLPAGGPIQVREQAEVLQEILPEEGLGEVAALLPLVQAFSWGSVDLTHPSAVGYLQCPPLTVATAAQVVESALNQTASVWDGGPSTMELEQQVMRALCDAVGLPGGSAGVTTSGGSLSNLLAVVLARDVTGSVLSGSDLRLGGTISAGRRLRVVCSREAHLSVARAVITAGLGEQGLLTIEPDELGVMNADAVDSVLERLPADDLPFMLVATAGTTDLGAIDRLPELADLAARRGMWFHVDAAYGAGLLMSTRLRDRFDGIARADSVTMDMHKMLWHPTPSSVLLVARETDFGPLRIQAPYLDPAEYAAAGLPNRLEHTVQTTRRAAAFTMAAVFRALGRRGLGELAERCHEMARYAERRVRSSNHLEMAAPVSLTCVVFRYLPRERGRAGQINTMLHHRLLSEGRAVLGHTLRRAPGGEQVLLKVTVINPLLTERDIDALIAEVEATGHTIEAAA
jgi:L-2,4-diaminobutyrate decarboxylase